MAKFDYRHYDCSCMDPTHHMRLVLGPSIPDDPWFSYELLDIDMAYNPLTLRQKLGQLWAMLRGRGYAWGFVSLDPDDVVRLRDDLSEWLDVREVRSDEG